MRITETIKVMKQINPDKVMLLKVGRFYYQYGKDAYILAYNIYQKDLTYMPCM